MRQYVVKRGDTLSSIARRLLGSAGKWSVLADANHIADPNRIRVGQTLVIPPSETTEAPRVTTPGLRRDGMRNQAVTFSQEGKNVFAVVPSAGEKIWLGIRHKQGLYRNGVVQPEEFIAAQPPQLRDLRLNESEINVVLSTAENEGNLDAINTWDDSFLSFGMFQWTSGQRGDAGELPALLGIVKREFPEAFENYWGQFGLDVVEAGATTGRFSMDGQPLTTARGKEQLRDYAWVFRFVRAAADADIQGVEVLHAINRLDRFYFMEQPTLGGFSLARLITSEFGVGLLLDNHVNRPGYVVGCVAQAIAELHLTPEQLAGGPDATERQVLDRYLAIRETYGRSPMTKARNRGEVTRRYVTDGRISDRRQSFRSNAAERRG